MTAIELIKKRIKEIEEDLAILAKDVAEQERERLKDIDQVKKKDIKSSIELYRGEQTYGRTFGSYFLGYDWDLMFDHISDLKSTSDIEKAIEYLQKVLEVSERIRNEIPNTTESTGVHVFFNGKPERYLSGNGVAIIKRRIQELQEEKDRREKAGQERQEPKDIDQIKEDIRSSIGLSDRPITYNWDYGNKYLGYYWILESSPVADLKNIKDIDRAIDYLNKLLYVSEKVQEEIPDAKECDKDLKLGLKDSLGWEYLSDRLVKEVKARITELEEEKAKRLSEKKLLTKHLKSISNRAFANNTFSSTITLSGTNKSSWFDKLCSGDYIRVKTNLAYVFRKGAVLSVFETSGLSILVNNPYEIGLPHPIDKDTLLQYFEPVTVTKREM